MPILPTVKIKSLLGILFCSSRVSFFGRFDHINVHSIEVFNCSGGEGEGLEGLGSPSTSLGNLVSMVPLVLKVCGFSIPLVDFVRDSVKGYDSLHE